MSEVLPANGRILLIAETVGLTGVAMLAFILGHRSKSARRAGAKTKFGLPDPAPERALYIGIGAIAAGTMVLYVMYGVVGSVSYAFTHHDQVITLMKYKQSTFQLTRLTVVGVMVLLIDLRRRQTRWWVWMIAIAFALALVPFGSRQHLLFAFGLPVGLYHVFVRRLPARWFIPAGVIAALVLFSFSYLRLLGPERIGGAAGVFAAKPSAAIHFAFNASGELKIFDAATIVIRDTPEELPLTYGTNFFRVPWMIVPHRIWPEKPLPWGNVITQKYLPQLKAGRPPTAMGDLFLAGGWAAVPLGFFLFGWVARFVWEWRLVHLGLANTCLYLEFCAFSFDFTRVGDPSRTIMFLLIGTAFLVLVYGLAAPVPPNWLRASAKANSEP